ncbi:hypothetical protein SEVIR_8G079501v4 [Setaria viridis]
MCFLSSCRHHPTIDRSPVVFFFRSAIGGVPPPLLTNSKRSVQMRSADSAASSTNPDACTCITGCRSHRCKLAHSYSSSARALFVTATHRPTPAEDLGRPPPDRVHTRTHAINCADLDVPSVLLRCAYRRAMSDPIERASWLLPPFRTCICRTKCYV